VIRAEYAASESRLLTEVHYEDDSMIAGRVFQLVAVILDKLS
jgi:hypothetical protein